MKKHSIKRNIEILLVAASVISLIIISTATYFFIHKTLIENKKNEILTVSIEQSHETSERFNNSKLFTHMISTHTGVREFLMDRSETKRLQLNNIFLEHLKDNPNYLTLYLLDKNGIGLVSTDPRFVGQDYSFRNYFINAINGESYVDLALGITSDKLGYYFSEPVIGINGEVLGVFVLKIDEKDVDNQLVASPLSNDSVIMLVDEFGVVISTTQADRKLKSLGILTEEEKTKISENQKYLDTKIIPLQYELLHSEIENYKSVIITEFYDKDDGENEILTLVKISSYPFYLVVESRLNLLSSQVLNTIMTVISIIFIIFILMSIFIYQFVKYFIKPIDTIILFFKNNLSKNDFSKKLEIKTGDEFEDMTNVINDMTEELQKSYSILNDEVKKRTKEIEDEKGSLEIKVKERTIELENLKNNLEANISERTEKLNEKLKELEQMNKIMIGRELEMIRLKDELKEIKKVE